MNLMGNLGLTKEFLKSLSVIFYLNVLLIRLKSYWVDVNYIRVEIKKFFLVCTWDRPQIVFLMI